MRGSTWNYFVPYETDVAAALQRLREAVFARGEYQSVSDLLLPLPVEAGAGGPVAHGRDLNKGPDLVRLIGDWHQPPQPTARTEDRAGSIRELLDRQGSAGTHSILDITAISTRSKSGAISPVSPVAQWQIFGGETPEHREIQVAFEAGAFAEHLSRRGQGLYLIAYRSGVPDEIFFLGRSGG
jgi:hypothetical protein